MAKIEHGIKISYRESVEKVKEMERLAPKTATGRPNLSQYLRDLTSKDIKNDKRIYRSHKCI